MTLGSAVLFYSWALGKIKILMGKIGWVGGLETILDADGFLNFSIITDETPKSIIAVTS